MIETILTIDPKLAAAGGAVGSALLAACGYIAKIRYERKRTLRSTLFYLLQLRHSAVTDELLTTQLPDWILSAFKSALAERSWQLSDEETQSMLQQARPILVAVAERQSGAEQQEIRGHLLKSLSDLAKDQPVLAYRLSAALPELKLPDNASEARASDFPAEAADVARMISGSIRVGFHAEGARQSKHKLSGLIYMASFEIGVLAFLQTYLILRRQNHVKVPNAFLDAIAKSAATSVQELVDALASVATSDSASLAPKESRGPFASADSHR
ncbi:hypothetical protein G8A07_04840 [Roseateles sp. DAIF2]|uniref:hypothetical protein n=1 Tax=Roseateles sp. DAIF2 TaxID=2714952 RepID=UPI0018A29925|nr:hypothetical protein [Roseateles sp. DAIF2]QPF72323.1 hypothetical protein G8A07_04840 [Roseateles sp. DAIF2]